MPLAIAFTAEATAFITEATAFAPLAIANGAFYALHLMYA
jgi:hypothetical protein